MNRYFAFYEEIKALEDGKWIPTFLIRMTDNNPTAIKRWGEKGWEIYQGDEMNDFMIKNANFDLYEFLDRVELPRLRFRRKLDEFIDESKKGRQK